MGKALQPKVIRIPLRPTDDLDVIRRRARARGTRYLAGIMVPILGMAAAMMLGSYSGFESSGEWLLVLMFSFVVFVAMVATADDAMTPELTRSELIAQLRHEANVLERIAERELGPVAHHPV